MVDLDRFEEIKQKCMVLKGQKEYLTGLVQEKTEMETQLDTRYSAAIRAREYIREVAERTQRQLSFHIASLVSTAIASVYEDDPEKFIVDFVKRRKTVECDLLFEKGDQKFSPIGFTGGGVLDVTCFALRCAFWSFKRNRPCIILDEPFRNCSPDLQDKVGEMIKMVSEGLGLQFIMVSHAEDVNIAADKVFRVKKDSQGISRVEVET